MFATIYNRQDMFQLLLNKGARLDLSVPNCDGDVLLHELLQQISETGIRADSLEEQALSLSMTSAPSLEAYIEEKREQRRILLAHLKALPRQELTSLINSPAGDGGTAIIYAAKYIQEADEAGMQLLELIIANTTNPEARVGPFGGVSAVELALAHGNTAFCTAYLIVATRALGLQ